MGVPTLKIKKNLNYRKGPTWASCSDCNHYRSKTHAEGRCTIIGLNDGRAYRVLPHYICDRHDNSKCLRRLGVKV